MKSRTYRSLAALAITTSALAASVIAGGPSANAASSTPPWEPDPSAVGTIAFYDSSGNVITSGSTSTKPFAAYAVGSQTVRSGDTHAVIRAANPDPNSPITSWFKDDLGTFSTYPLTTSPTPANIQTLSQTNPVAVGTSGDLSLDDFYNESVHYTGTGYTDMIQLRMITANPSGSQGSSYDDADVLVDPTNHTFQIVYPAPTVTVTVPGAPTGVSAVPGNASATVSWTAPADNGGGVVTGYDVQYSADGGTTWTSASAAFNTSTATTEKVTGLTNAKAYEFRVAAINSAGTGAYSAASTAVTPVAPAPPAPDATTISITAPATVNYGATATLSTVLTDSKTHRGIASQTVSLYRRASSSKSFALVKSVKTASTGAARYAVRETANEQFEWRFAASSTHKAATSAVRSVVADQTISIARTPATVKHGKSVKIYGAVNPAGSGKISLQRDISGKWRAAGSATIKRQKLPNGKTQVGYVFTVKLAKKGSYVYRVTKAKTSTLGAGISAKITARAS